MAFRYKRDKSKKHIFIAGFIILLIILIGFVSTIGNVLVEQDNLKKSDIIVVLMGSIPDRIIEGAELYNEGYGSKIILVEEHKTGQEILEQKNIDVPMGEKINKLIAIEMGVVPEDILIVPANTHSTQDEAIKVREFLKDNKDISSLILVTSKYHSFRAKQIFSKALDALGHDVEIISRPTKYDEFNPNKWWKNREDSKRVIFEVLKLINFYMREQFKL